MENLLGDILTTVKFKSVLYFKYGFCSPWGMDVSKGNFSQFHLVTHGTCVLKTDGKSIDLEKGDVVIFPHGFPHQIKDASTTICRSGKEVVTEIMNGKQPFEGEVAKTHLICGHYEMDDEVSHPIFEKFPEYIIIKSSEYGRFDLISSVFELIIEEMTHKKAGYENVSLRLSEILFISITRHYYLNQSSEKRNLFKDQAIYQVIETIHKELGNQWTIQKLTRQAGISRTLFIERFKNAVGSTPMKYIANWRMVKAKYLLKNTDLPMVEIGEQIGYSSEPSFNRIFKQTWNISPGKFRRKSKIVEN